MALGVAPADCAKLLALVTELPTASVTYTVPPGKVAEVTVKDPVKAPLASMLPLPMFTAPVVRKMLQVVQLASRPTAVTAMTAPCAPDVAPRLTDAATV